MRRSVVWFSERINLAEDYARVFGPEKPPLIAVAVSSDSVNCAAKMQGRNAVPRRALALSRTPNPKGVYMHHLSQDMRACIAACLKCYVAQSDARVAFQRFGGG